MWITLNSVLGIDGGVVDSRGGSSRLSSAHDRNWMDAIRDASDAVLVGAGTIRSENPSLVVHSPGRLAERAASGRPAQPLPVVLTERGDLDRGRRIFAGGEPRPLILVSASGRDRAAPLCDLADVEVLDAGMAVIDAVIAALAARGVSRLLVEGGPTVARTFAAHGAVNEVCLTLSPRLGGFPPPPVDRAGAPPLRDMTLAESRVVDGFVYLRYLAATARVAS